MTRREKLIEARNAIIEGRERVADRTIWQNELIWWLCKAVLLLIEKELGEKKDTQKETKTEGCRFCSRFDKYSLRDDRGFSVYAKYCPRCGKEWNNG